MIESENKRQENGK